MTAGADGLLSLCLMRRCVITGIFFWLQKLHGSASFPACMLVVYHVCRFACTSLRRQTSCAERSICTNLKFLVSWGEGGGGSYFGMGFFLCRNCWFAFSKTFNLCRSPTVWITWFWLLRLLSGVTVRKAVASFVSTSAVRSVWRNRFASNQPHKSQMTAIAFDGASACSSGLIAGSMNI